MNEQPWKAEPDFVEFKHDGFHCVIVRNLDLGHLCGYVGVPKGHPLFGKDYNHLEGTKIIVHGGLTYAKDQAPGSNKKGLWWFGFDCAHHQDLIPRMMGNKGVYRNLEYVTSEVKNLAEQLVVVP